MKINEELKLTNNAILPGCNVLSNEVSVRLHESFGYIKIASCTGSGRKFNKWIMSVVGIENTKFIGV